MRARVWVSVICAVMVAGVTAVAAGCSESRTMIGEDADGGSARVGVGQVLEVTLESNPTTGYSWQVAETPDFLTLEGPAAFISDAGPDVVGAGGSEVFRFTVSGAGTGTLRLEYLRPWEDAPPTDVYEVEITAK
jgi:inhibitor of cysteine peptidase